MKNIWVLQAYGNKEVFAEAIWCLASAWIADSRFNEHIQVVIFTDDQEYLESRLPFLADIDIIDLNQEKLLNYKGEFNFVHRVKIKVLIEAHEKYPLSDVLYTDTDIIFDESPINLFKKIETGSAVMHTNEGALEGKGSSYLNRKIYHQLNKRHIEVRGEVIRFDKSFTMYNAGVLGINKTSAEEILQLALNLTDNIYAQYPKHTIEQLAFSYAMQKNGSIISAEKETVHYWNLKEARPMLQYRIEKMYADNQLLDRASWAKELKALDLAKWSEEKSTFRNFSPLKRALLRFVKKDWKVPQELQLPAESSL